MMTQSALGWTLIHFLWQGALVAIAHALIEAATRKASSKFRYGLASTALVVMFLSAVVTFAILLPSPASTTSATTAVEPAAWIPRHSSIVQDTTNYMPWLVYFWLAGVAVFSLRLGVQWFSLRRVRRQAVRPSAEEWQHRVARISARLGLRRTVRLYESTLADVPAALGWLKPVILVPAGALAHLSQDQMESLLTHELAHVLRHDYLVNLLQSFMETLFFYHPGVWWVSRRMRDERENCCDDLAVSMCGDPVRYARALAEMESLRNTAPSLAMAANGGSLLRRIQRLLAPQTSTRSIAPLSIVALTVVALGVALWATPQSVIRAASQPEITAAGEDAEQAETPAKPEQPARPERPPKPETPGTGESYLDRIEKAGFRGLSVDELVAMKIHGVTPEFIGEMKARGFKLSPDELVAMKIHGVDAAYIEAWKQAGLRDLDVDQLQALKIHGASPAEYRELQSLGYGKLTPDELVECRVMGVTPDFIRETRKKGLGNLDIDRLVQLKQMGILDRQ